MPTTDAGPFASLSHAELAALGREYLMAGHLIDRAGMPALIAAYGIEMMRDVAIDEWMAASPIYTKRTQALLGFAGDDVETIFKGMQFDIGAPHEFMDFRYQVHDADHGEFWLAHCGALMDVEPMGEDFVVAMCHDIEDPTFDATACATNPRAQVRPIHRPPRTPADRQPHCHWTVTIVHEAEPLHDPEVMGALVDSRAAATPLPTIDPADTDGASDYTDALDLDLRLEHFSSSALRALLHELALQGHLLTRSFLLAIARRTSVGDAQRVGAHQMTGIVGLTAKRLARHLGATGTLADIARVIDVHPAFQPVSYAELDVIPDSGSGPVATELTLSLGDADGMHEQDGLSWPALLAAGNTDALTALVQAVNPRAQCEVIGGAGAREWKVWIDEAAEPAKECDDVMMASFSTGTDWAFVDPPA